MVPSALQEEGCTGLPTRSMGHRPNSVLQGEGGRLGFITVTPAFPLVWGMDILWKGGDSPREQTSMNTEVLSEELASSQCFD